jgi:quercetin dioxygenase-like cupin family protein
MRYVKSVATMLLGIGISVPGAYGQVAGENVVKLPDQIEWKTPAISPGPSRAVLYGDPTKAGVYVERVKFPPGFKIMPHTHPDEWRTVVVVSGTQYFGIGDTWDDNKLTPYPTGTFFTEPKTAAHFIWAKDGEVVIQVTGMGPTGTNLVKK